MKFSESIKELAPALALVQAEIGNAYTNKAGYNYKYADLASILDMVKPLLAKHGFSLVQGPDESTVPDRVIVETMLLHKSGEYIMSRLDMAIHKAKNPSQEVGSCISYARRYALAAMLSIAQTDDDAAVRKDTNEVAVNNAMQTGTPATLHPNQVHELQLLLVEAGLPESKIFQMTNKPSLGALSEDEYRRATDWLKRTIQKRNEHAKG